MGNTTMMGYTATRGIWIKITPRLPSVLHQELKRTARELGVSLNYLMEKAMEHYLRELERNQGEEDRPQQRS